MFLKKDGAAALSYEMANMMKNEKYTDLIQLHEKINKNFTDENTYFLRRYELLGVAYSKMNIDSSYNKVMKIIKDKKINMIHIHNGKKKYQEVTEILHY